MGSENEGDTNRHSVVQFGLGPIGCRVLEYALDRPFINVVGGVDIDPEKVGRDIGVVAGLDREIGIEVKKTITEVCGEAKPDIVIHTTGSKLDEVYGQLEAIIREGLNIVSTCEELAYPYKRHPDLSARLDEEAKEHGVTVLGTGINPGFLMDTWPLVMTGVCREVKSMTVTRIQDARFRRVPFQRKIGAGLTENQFHEKVESGNFGHVGLQESMYLIANGLDWDIENRRKHEQNRDIIAIDTIEETIEPIILDHTVASDHITVEPGMVAGLRQSAIAFKDGNPVITMDFLAYLGAPESYDEVRIDGTPPIRARIIGGTNGDVGTASIVLNAVPRVIEAGPGLKTMTDIPLVSCRKL